MSPPSGPAVAEAPIVLGPGARNLGVLKVLREDAPALTVFFGPGLLGWVGTTLLLLFGAVPGYLGGLLLVLWPAVSFPLYLQAYRWADRRERRRRVEAFADERLPRLAGRVISLHGRQVPASAGGAARETEVFALFLLSCRVLEDDGGLREAGEAVERGVLLADELLADAPEVEPVGGPSGYEVVMAMERERGRHG
jgi:hypothetical protein